MDAVEKIEVVAKGKDVKVGDLIMRVLLKNNQLKKWLGTPSHLFILHSPYLKTHNLFLNFRNFFISN